MDHIAARDIPEADFTRRPPGSEWMPLRAPARNQARASLPLAARAGGLPSVLVFGKPLGASRPASARLPRQSASSLSESENARPAPSSHAQPCAAAKVFTSERPPSL